ncbi:MAG: hypothetical protein KDA79_23360, partial [Planctomycetaceae bacterium]|nr:hypothetical protein [Planctomycetaceae bacterium]
RILEFAATVDPVALRQQAIQNLSDRREEFQRVPDGNAAEFNSYFDMVTFPQRYAGRAVLVRGNVRRILSYQAPEGCDAETLYESWVYSADSAANPVIVLTTSLPEGLAPGEELFASVSVTGYFFKLFNHLPQQPERRAPLLLAADLGGQSDREVGLTGIDPAWWTVVRDRTRGVREAETELYYRVLHLARNQDRGDLASAAAAHSQQRRAAVPLYQKRPDLPFNTFVDLFQHPDENHGQPVTLTGHVRAWKTYPAGSNPYRLETLHELWIYPEGGLQNPAVVITTDLPAGFPRLTSEDQVIDNVRVSGWFFKLYGYSAEDTARIAPMVLAADVSWFPADDLQPPGWIAPAIGIGAALGIVVLAVLLWRSGRRDRTAGARLRGDDEPPANFSFDEVSTGSPPDFPSENPG